jgi:RHS repeat-associated protein
VNFSILPRETLTEDYTTSGRGDIVKWNSSSTTNGASATSVFNIFRWWGGESFQNTNSSDAKTTYYDQFGRQQQAVHLNGIIDEFSYDGAGNRVWSYQSSTTNGRNDERVSFYGADGKLRADDHRKMPSSNGAMFSSVFEEYRYDALGRRTWVRTRNWCQGDYSYNGLCRINKIRRVVWDGSAELYEIQMPDTTDPQGLFDFRENDVADVPKLAPLDALPIGAGGQTSTEYLRVDPNTLFGRVAYTYGLGTDAPVSVARFNYASAMVSYDDPENVLLSQKWRPRVFASTLDRFTPQGILPLWNSQGKAELGVFSDGGATTCMYSQEGASNQNCVQVFWPRMFAGYKSETGYGVRTMWHGSLLEDKQDASGLVYRRNRFYDPKTGTFTQEDPIGLAGGLNLYGYTGGDPANFSDPFGLCKRPEGLRPGETGICVETFIAHSSHGVPRWSANNRTYSSSGGGYKTSDRFIVGRNGVRDVSSGVGNTGPIQGVGIVRHTSTSSGDGTTIHAKGEARTMSPWPPFNIDYDLNISVSKDGKVDISGTHDGFPSYEVWAYRDGQKPELVYKHDEGHVLQLGGCCDVKVP